MTVWLTRRHFMPLLPPYKIKVVVSTWKSGGESDEVPLTLGPPPTYSCHRVPRASQEPSPPLLRRPTYLVRFTPQDFPLDLVRKGG